MRRCSQTTAQQTKACRLAPSNHHLAVLRYVTPETFRVFAVEAGRMGFTHAASAPLVRSSYHADQQAHAAGIAAQP
jgi:lipoic acid synthetase